MSPKRIQDSDNPFQLNKIIKKKVPSALISAQVAAITSNNMNINNNII